MQKSDQVGRNGIEISIQIFILLKAETKSESEEHILAKSVTKVKPLCTSNIINTGKTLMKNVL